MNYRVVKTVPDRQAVATIHFVALGSQLMFFRYLGPSEACCSPQLSYRLSLMELGHRYHALGRHSKPGVGFSAAGQMCFGQPSLFALLMLMLKAESFLALSLTPQSRETEGQCFPCYCLSVVPKFTVGCQDQLFPPIHY